MERFDVVIAGGGVAGAASAAALAQRGLGVLLCEAKLPDHRRLAGELMHPCAVDDLRRLGLLAPLADAGGVPIDGFAVIRDARDRGLLLAYRDGGRRPRAGFAVEHATMTRALLDAVSRRPGIVVWHGARVVGGDFACAPPAVRVRGPGGEREVGARVVVSAEGRQSNLREQVGIHAARGEVFRMVGWKVRAGRLPHPTFGNVFIGGRTPTLSYPISRDAVRVMFELRTQEDLAEIEERLAALPMPFRDDVRRAIDTEPRQVGRIVTTLPARVTSGCVVVVGDAGGCVHPLTATGITFCTGDAIRLAEALERSRGAGAVERALARYARARRAPMRVRVALGPAVVDAFSSRQPDMRLLRDGLFRYWRRSSRARGLALALLSADETRMVVAVREFAIVVLFALVGLGRGVLPGRDVAPAVAGLLRRAARLGVQALGRSGAVGRSAG